MGYDDRRKRKEELDSFWEIERIAPAKKIYPNYQKRNTDTVEISVSSVLESLTDSSTFHSSSLSFAPDLRHGTASKKSEPSDEYEPENSLIHRVRIYNVSSQYKYYEDFYATAQRYKNERRESAEYTPFFSYVPQYDQLNPKQLDYYLYFRTKAREGIFVEADMSYVSLYAYELINLSDSVSVSESQKMLYALWCEYGKRFPKLHKQLIEWVCDFSLIHKLPPPENADVRAVAEVCSLKEFFVPHNAGEPESIARILLDFSSSYDYRKSKFYVGEAVPLFDEHIPKVLGSCIKKLSIDGMLSLYSSGDSTLPRDAYAGALCCYKVKKKIEVDFCSFSRTNDLRYVVGEVLKYAENKIRAYVGVKSRLTCYVLDNSVRDLIDYYFSVTLIKVARPAKKEKREDYDVLYDLPRSTLSLEGAQRIEAESWETTRRLVEAFEGDETEAVTEIKVGKAIADDTPPTLESESELVAALSELYAFALAVLREDREAQKREAARLCRLPDSIVDSINEISADIIGDKLIEDGEDGYAVIEDYKDTLL